MSTKIDFTKPIRTRDGRPATWLRETQNIQVVETESGVYYFYADGRYMMPGVWSKYKESPLDLFNVESVESIDWSKPVETTDGRPVRVLCTDAGSDHPVVCLVPALNNSYDYTVRFTSAGASPLGSVQLRNVTAEPLEVRKVLSVYRNKHTGFVWVNSSGAQCPGDGAELLGYAEVAFTLQFGPDGKPI